jgi:hypothetical protein
MGPMSLDPKDINEVKPKNSEDPVSADLRTRKEDLLSIEVSTQEWGFRKHWSEYPGVGIPQALKWVPRSGDPASTEVSTRSGDPASTEVSTQEWGSRKHWSEYPGVGIPQALKWVPRSGDPAASPVSNISSRHTPAQKGGEEEMYMYRNWGGVKGSRQKSKLP